MFRRGSGVRSAITGSSWSALGRHKDAALILAVVAVAAILGLAIGAPALTGSPGATSPSAAPIAAAETPSASLGTSAQVDTPAPTATPIATPSATPTESSSTTPTAAPTPTAKPKPTATPEPSQACDVLSSAAGTPRQGPVWSTSAPPADAAIPAIAAGHFAAAAALPKGGGYDTATLLGNGRVLFLGAGTPELYDPPANKWTAAGSMVDERRNPLATLLANGKVLVVGGSSFKGCALTDIETVELYDPATNRFSSVDAPMPGGDYTTATRLFDGTVLLTGGWTISDDKPDGYRSSAIFNPTTGEFTLIGGSVQPAGSSALAVLADHSVLFAGGLVSGGESVWLPTSSAVLYRPGEHAFVPVTTSMTVARGQASATAMAGGKVLIVGGVANEASNQCPAECLSSAEIYDPATGGFIATGAMSTGRAGQTATLLHSGGILVTGGVAGSMANSAEVWLGGTFQATAGRMTHSRLATLATLLPDGRVLVVGNGSADLYQP